MKYEFEQVYELRYQDVDSETGKTIQDNLIAIVPDDSTAGWLCYKASLNYHDPNRKFYVIKIEKNDD